MKKISVVLCELRVSVVSSVVLRGLCVSVVSLLILQSCNIPKDGEQENIATSKLEMLTNLGNDTAKVVKDTTAKPEAH